MVSKSFKVFILYKQSQQERTKESFVKLYSCETIQCGLFTMIFFLSNKLFMPLFPPLLNEYLTPIHF